MNGGILMDFKSIVGHEDIIKHFKSSIEIGRVSHAYIICGEEGSGRMALAFSYAKTLLCEKGGEDACNECKSCKQADSSNHPDIIYVKHEKPNIISIDEIREQVVNTISIKPYQSKYKIYIIDGAEKMNVQAQNALLKTIEEPPHYAIIILLSTVLDKLLPTIQSRCITLSTKPVKENDIIDYLMKNYNIPKDKAKFAFEYSQGNLGKAIRLATNTEYEKLVESVIDLETRIYEMDMEDIKFILLGTSGYMVNTCEYLDLMMMWYRDVLMLKVTGNPDRIIFKEQYSTIKEQSKYLSFNEIEAKAKAIERAKERLSANARLEDVMRLLIMTLKEI